MKINYKELENIEREREKLLCYIETTQEKLKELYIKRQNIIMGLE